MNDKYIIRELAKQYMQIACSEKQQKANQRMKDTNDLKIVRPPVIIDEIPWYQIKDDILTCLCTDERARALEYELRKVIYRDKYFRADILLEPFYRVTMAIDSTGTGLNIKEEILRTDDFNNIVSHHYEDILEDEESLDRLFHMPEFTLRPDKDEEAMNYYTDLLGDAMPVKLCGRAGFTFEPWDTIAMLRGMEPILYDLYDRPEYLHRIMEKLSAAATAQMDFIETNSHVDSLLTSLHRTPGLVSGLAEDGWKATWFRGAAQGFSVVSPEMHEEFEINYIKPIAERCAYTYYGCCEPLDNKMEIIQKISNLRKVGVSPWANIQSMAEQIGGRYVYSRKPNPANVAVRTNPEVIQKEIEDTVKACIRYGCPCDITLKDISTIGHHPENLIVWADTVSNILDYYYGKE